MARELIAEVKDGTRVILGTEHPILSQVHREGPRRWRATYGLCNGVPNGSKVFPTRREALAAIGYEGKL